MRDKKSRRAINLGTPGNPPGESEQTPCAIALEMALLQLPSEQRGQLKPILTIATGMFTAHIDHLHRETTQLKQTVVALTELVRQHDLTQHTGICEGCTMTVGYVLENGCMNTEHIEAGTECDFLRSRRLIHGVEKVQEGDDAGDTGNQAATRPPSDS